jgi:hypothetical protein
MLYDQVGLVGTDYAVEDQYLRLSSVDGVDGVFYILETKGGWSFSEPEDILKLIESFIKISEGLH